MRKKVNSAGMSKAPSQRQLRVSEEIRHALSQMVLQANFRDPELVDQPITVTEVKVSPDMRNATVFVIPLIGDPQIILPALSRAASYIRGQLSSSVKLRHTPILKFEYDDSFDNAERIEMIINKTNSGKSRLNQEGENGS